MWKEFITGYRRPREGEPNNVVYPERCFINLAAVIAVDDNHYTEVWDMQREEHIEIPCVSLLYGNKQIYAIEVEYDAIVALLRNIPKNSPFHKGVA